MDRSCGTRVVGELGHPAAAIAWPASTLADFDTALEPGHLVLPGAMTTAPCVGAVRQAEARFGGLGPGTDAEAPCPRLGGAPDVGSGSIPRRPPTPVPRASRARLFLRLVQSGTR